MEDKTTFVIAVMALLLSIGVPVTDTVFDNELKDYFVCDIDSSIEEFKGGISGTAYTGYPYADSRVGYIRCGNTEKKGQGILRVLRS